MMFQMVRDNSKSEPASADAIVTQLLHYHMPLLYFVCNHLIDVCFEIYVMMSSDLYGTCSSADVIVMFHTNSNLPHSHGTQNVHNCNPFGNIATVAVSCKTSDHADIVYSICNIFHFICIPTGKIVSKTPLIRTQARGPFSDPQSNAILTRPSTPRLLETV